MTMRDWVVCLLLVIGVTGFVLTSLGLLLNKDFYNQIHYLAPASLIGSVAIPLAVLVHEGFSQSGSKSILIAVLLFLSNPVLSHTTARANRVRNKQPLTPESMEAVRQEEQS